LKDLPEPIAEVEIPETFSVSEVASTQGCLFRMVLSRISETVASLPTNPAGELGRVLHALLEMAVQGRITCNDSPANGVENALDDLLREARDRLERDPLKKAYADLPKTMTPLVWARKRRIIVDAALRFLGTSGTGKPWIRDTEKAKFRYEDLHGPGRWAEVYISAPSLRLIGRMDLVENDPEGVTIRDLKSGQTHDESGQIKQSIVLQLHLYGVMVLGIESDVPLKLVVDDGEEHVIPFDSEDADRIREWLRSILDALPTHSIVFSNVLGTVGPACSSCGFRYRCETYLATAPLLWKAGAAWPLPLDIWGTVERLVVQADGLVHLTISDAASRLVKVFGIRETHIPGLHISDFVWLFGLKSLTGNKSKGTWRHPLNFHEIMDDDPRHRAWALQVFGGSPQISPVLCPASGESSVYGNHQRKEADGCGWE
jgi:hypothetical protein